MGGERLDGDLYVHKLNTIIQRKFFPQIPRLISKLEWLEAIRSGNTEQIRNAQLNIYARLSSNQISKNIQDYGDLKLQFDEGYNCFDKKQMTPVYIPKHEDFRCSLEKRFHIANVKKIESIKMPASTGIMLDEFCALYVQEDNGLFNQTLSKEISDLDQFNHMRPKYLVEKIKRNHTNYNYSPRWEEERYYLSWHQNKTNLKPSNSKSPTFNFRDNFRVNGSADHIFLSRNPKTIIKPVKTKTSISILTTPKANMNKKFSKTPFKTTFNLCSEDSIDLLPMDSVDFDILKFKIKEPSKKEEALRRLADQIKIKNKQI